MSRTNLWTSNGLVNGALETVRDILYETGKRPMPVTVMVEFDRYDGPCLPGTNMLPITSLARSFTEKNTPCTRTQFPLALAWPVTIHESQGLTLKRAVVDTGRREYNSDLRTSLLLESNPRRDRFSILLSSSIVSKKWAEKQ